MRPYLAQFTVMLVLTVMGSLPPAGHAQSDDAVASQFVGAWEYVMSETRQDDGTWVRVEGPPDRVGLITYTPSGHMSVHLMRRERGTSGGYTAYFGPYEVNASEGYVIHHRSGHLDPDNVGVDAKRFFAFAEDRLTLTVAPENRNRLTWRRLP